MLWKGLETGSRGCGFSKSNLRLGIITFHRRILVLGFDGKSLLILTNALFRLAYTMKESVGGSITCSALSFTVGFCGTRSEAKVVY